MWIELPWPENLANTYMRHRETLDSCFNLIRSHQQCYTVIAPATTECRAKTLPLSHQPSSHTNDAKSTSHGNCVANSVVACSITVQHCWWDLIRLKQLSSVSLCRMQVFTGFSGHGNSIHNIILLLKKEKVHLHYSSLFYFFNILMFIMVVKISTNTRIKSFC